MQEKRPGFIVAALNSLKNKLNGGSPEYKTSLHDADSNLAKKAISMQRQILSQYGTVLNNVTLQQGLWVEIFPDGGAKVFSWKGPIPSNIQKMMSARMLEFEALDQKNHSDSLTS